MKAPNTSLVCTNEENRTQFCSKQRASYLFWCLRWQFSSNKVYVRKNNPSYVFLNRPLTGRYCKKMVSNLNYLGIRVQISPKKFCSISAIKASKRKFFCRGLDNCKKNYASSLNRKAETRKMLKCVTNFYSCRYADLFLRRMEKDFLLWDPDRHIFRKLLQRKHWVWVVSTGNLIDQKLPENAFWSLFMLFTSHVVYYYLLHFVHQGFKWQLFTWRRTVIELFALRES